MEEPKVEKVEKTPVQLLQEFLDKEGLVITANPQFIPSGHDSFEIGVAVGIQKKEGK